MITKKNNGEVENLKRAVRVLKKEIQTNNERINNLHPIKDGSLIEKIKSIILKKEKQKQRLKKKIG